MGLGDIAGASRPSGRLLLASLLIWLILAIALPLSALTLNFVRIGGFPLGFWIAAQGAIIGLVALVAFYAWRAGGVPVREGIRPALIFAGEIVGAVALLGFTGYIAAMGYDGLALPLGLVAGVALLAILVAPRFVLYPVQSISGFFAIRYGGSLTRRMAFVIAFAATCLLLAADIRAGSLALQSLTGLMLHEAILGLAFAVAAIWLAGIFLAPAKMSAGMGFIAVFVGLLATLIALAVFASGAPLPHLSLGSALESHANLNQTLVVNRLSDVKSLTPMASPFLQLSMKNFAGLLLAVALGVVAAPHLLGRHVSQSAVAPGGAVKRTALALVGVAILIASLPPLAIYSRIGFEETMSKGIEIAAIPQSFAEASALGWVKVCDQTSPATTDLAAACAKAAGQRGFLRLQDLAFTTDGFVVAAPRISGLNPMLEYPLLIGVIIASILVGNALISSIVVADGEIRSKRDARAPGLDFRSVTIGGTLLIAAALLALYAATGTALLAAEGFAVLAAGIFPALVLGLHWRHMNAAGAVAAMLVGTLITAVYLLGVHFWPVELFSITGGLSDAPAMAAKRFADLQATLAAATTPEAAAQARAALAKHVTTIANWGGLKPAAITLVAVPASFVAGLLISLLLRPRKKTEQAPA
ncbi:sodium:solute symporter family transporter [Hyphomicrobium sp.]|uniref:sodium:solute symporter family transporter n=1 Tax=Hyphomicrobium sp. TaxID=82 RepID=UPI002D78D8E8|nr:sodium/substrate symporter small subunit [Hyphomicrobium sp.]HET6388920.1 sodium/substrate symporter small subunit [Hyphomicrobium sp.]